MTADILICHRGKCTGVSNNMNNGSVLLEHTCGQLEWTISLTTKRINSTGNPSELLCWWKSQTVWVLPPKKISGREAWHLDWTRILKFPPKHQAGLLRHEVRDLVHFLAKGKILFGQSWCWGLQCLRQPLHILLGAFEQMNVNSRSNVTRRKQTPMGNWLGCFVLFFSWFENI